MRSCSRPATVQVASPEPTEPTPYALASLPSLTSPSNTPSVDPHLWHPFGEAAFRGQRLTRASQFIGRQSPGRKGEMGAAHDVGFGPAGSLGE